MTEWRAIPDTNYLASDDGQIRHVNAETIRKPYCDTKGYLYIGFWRRKKQCCATVHTLVALAFHGPKPDGMQVRHLDGNKKNNRPENLVYGTARENAGDRERHGNTRRGERNGNAVLSNTDTDFIRLLYARGCASQYELAALFGTSQAQVHNIVRNKQRRVA